METYRRVRERSRSPRRENPRNDRARHVPKFDDSPKEEQRKPTNVVNQLSTDALYKQARPYRPRNNGFSNRRDRRDDFSNNRDRNHNFANNRNDNFSNRRNDDRRSGNHSNSKYEYNPYGSSSSKQNDHQRDRNYDRRDRHTDSKFAIDPLSVPRAGNYFEHDDRFSGEESESRRDDRRYKSQNSYAKRTTNGNSSSRRNDDYGYKRTDYTSSDRDSNRRDRDYSNRKDRDPQRDPQRDSQRDSYRESNRDRSDGFWKHDKFQELDKDERKNDKRRDISSDSNS